MIDGETKFKDAKLYQFCFLSQVARVAKVRGGFIADGDFQELREDFNKRFSEYASETYGAEEAEKFVTSTLIPISEGFIATGMAGNTTKDGGLGLLEEYALNLRDGDRTLSPHSGLSEARGEGVEGLALGMYNPLDTVIDFKAERFRREGLVSLPEALRPNPSGAGKNYEDEEGGVIERKGDVALFPREGGDEGYDVVVEVFSAAANSPKAPPVPRKTSKDDEVRLEVAAHRAKDSAEDASEEKYSSSDDEANAYTSVVVGSGAAVPTSRPARMADATKTKVIHVANKQGTRSQGDN